MTLPTSYINEDLSAHLRKLAEHISRLEIELDELRQRDALDPPLGFNMEEYLERLLKINSLVPAVIAARDMLTNTVQVLIDFEQDTTPITPAH